MNRPITRLIFARDETLGSMMMDNEPYRSHTVRPSQVCNHGPPLLVDVIVVPLCVSHTDNEVSFSHSVRMPLQYFAEEVL